MAVETSIGRGEYSVEAEQRTAGQILCSTIYNLQLAEILTSLTGRNQAIRDARRPLKGIMDAPGIDEAAERLKGLFESEDVSKRILGGQIYRLMRGAGIPARIIEERFGVRSHSLMDLQRLSSKNGHK